MIHLPSSILFVLSLFVSAAQAQITYRRRRPSLGRIIAGAVVGGLAALFFICLLMMLLRRRRLARRTLVNMDGQYQPPQHKPLFGGPWGQHNQGYPNGGQHYPQQSFGGPNNMNGQPPYNSEYPNANTGAAPPAYFNDKQNGNSSYAPPSGPPPNSSSAQQFAPPPGPPPAAHTKGQDQSFVGGFRQ